MSPFFSSEPLELGFDPLFPVTPTLSSKGQGFYEGFLILRASSTASFPYISPDLPSFSFLFRDLVSQVVDGKPIFTSREVRSSNTTGSSVPNDGSSSKDKSFSQGKRKKGQFVK